MGPADLVGERQSEDVKRLLHRLAAPQRLQESNQQPEPSCQQSYPAEPPTSGHSTPQYARTRRSESGARINRHREASDPLHAARLLLRLNDPPSRPPDRQRDQDEDRYPHEGLDSVGGVRQASRQLVVEEYSHVRSWRAVARYNRSAG